MITEFSYSQAEALISRCLMWIIFYQKVFLHGILKIVDAGELSFVLKLFHVTLYEFKGAL